jgi:acyl-CoA thioester hydrolase
MKIKIYYEDTDAGGVVYYANYLRYFERARIEYISRRGIDLKKLEAKGIYFVVVRTEIDYRRPAKLYDILEVKIKTSEVKKVSFWTEYQVTRKEDKETIVTGRSKLVCINDNFKVIPIPKKIITKL